MVSCWSRYNVQFANDQKFQKSTAYEKAIYQIVSFQSTVLSIQCWKCHTDYSWEKCQYYRTQITCPASKPKCLDLQIRRHNANGWKDTFIKGCTDGSFRSLCGGNACIGTPCDGDLCNSAIPKGGIYPTNIVPHHPMVHLIISSRVWSSWLASSLL